MKIKNFGALEEKISPAQAYVLSAVTVFLWALGVVIARAVHEEIPLIGLSFYRWTIATLVLLPFVWRELKEGTTIIRTNIKVLVVQGVLIVGSGTLLFYAMNFTTAINATLVNATQPVVTTFLAWILLRDRLNGIQMLGVASAVLGVGIMVSRADWHVIASFSFNTGDLLVALAIVGYALYAINLRNLPAQLGAFPTLFVILAAGSFFLLPFYIAETLYVRPVPFAFKTVGLVITLAVLVSILSMAMWNVANRVVGPGRAAVFVNLIPVYGAILATSFLDEKLFYYHVLGGFFVCAGILMVIRQHALSNRSSKTGEHFEDESKSVNQVESSAGN